MINESLLGICLLFILIDAAQKLHKGFKYYYKRRKHKKEKSECSSDSDSNSSTNKIKDKFRELFKDKTFNTV